MDMAIEMQRGDILTAYLRSGHQVALAYRADGDFRVTVLKDSQLVEDPRTFAPHEELRARNHARHLATDAYGATGETFTWTLDTTRRVNTALVELKQTTTQRTAAATSDPMDRIIAAAAHTDGYIHQGGHPGQATTTQLLALHRRGLVNAPERRTDRKRSIKGAHLTAKGYRHAGVPAPQATPVPAAADTDQEPAAPVRPARTTWEQAGRPEQLLWFGRDIDPAREPRLVTFNHLGNRLYDAATGEQIAHYATDCPQWYAPAPATTVTEPAATPETPIVIVPCGAKKRPGLVRAAEKYTGPYARSARLAAETIAATTGARIITLSAKHGFLTDDDLVTDYDLTMGEPGSVTTAQLTEQAAALGITTSTVTVIAGKAYADKVTAIWPTAARPLDGLTSFGAQRARMGAIARGEHTNPPAAAGEPADPQATTTAEAEPDRGWTAYLHRLNQASTAALEPATHGHVHLAKVSTAPGARQHYDVNGLAYCGAGTGRTLAATRWRTDSQIFYVHTDICRRCAPALHRALTTAADHGDEYAASALSALEPHDPRADAALIADIRAHLTAVHTPAPTPAQQADLTGYGQYAQHLRAQVLAGFAAGNYPPGFTANDL